MGFVRDYTFSWTDISTIAPIKGVKEFGSEIIMYDEFDRNTGSLLHSLVVKTDLSGEPIWAKILLGVKRIYDIHKITSGDYLIISGDGSNLDSPRITRLDINGNFVWSKQVDSTYQRSFGNTFIEIDDNTFVLNWSQKEVLKFDYNGNILEHLRLVGAGGLIKRIVKDGNKLLLSGFLRLTTQGQDSFTNFFVIETDLNLSVTKQVGISNLQSDFNDPINGESLSIEQFERINNDYYVLAVYRGTADYKYVTYKIPVNLNVGSVVQAKKILNLTPSVTQIFDERIVLHRSSDQDNLVIDLDFSSYFNLGLKKEFTPSAQSGRTIIGVGDNFIYFKDLTGRAIGTIDRTLDFIDSCYSSTQATEAINREMVDSQVVVNNYYSFQSSIPTASNITVQVENATWIANLLCFSEGVSEEALNQEFFIKDFKINNVSTRIRFLNDIDGHYYWTDEFSKSEIILIKTDRFLNIVFVKKYNTNNIQFNFNNVIGSDDGNLLISGKLSTSSNSATVLKITSAGNPIWQKTYELPNNSGIPILKRLTNGLYLIVASAGRQLLKINEQGIVANSSRRVSGFLSQKVEIYNSHIYLIGYDGIGNNKIYGFAKLDFNLNLIETFYYSTDPNDNLVISGGFGINSVLKNNLLTIYLLNQGTAYLSTFDLGQPPLTASITVINEPNTTSQTIVGVPDGLIFTSVDTSITPGVVVISKLDNSHNFVFSKRNENLNIREIRPTTSGILIVRPTLDISIQNPIWNANSVINFDANLQQNRCVNFGNIASPAANLYSISRNAAALVLEIFTYTEAASTPTSEDIANVEFSEICKSLPPISQSPNLYLQAAGSTGSDGTTSGIHLRWLLKKDLINHLPKGNLATSTVNYNKPNDFVTIYRALYTALPITIDFSQPPKAVENRNALWVYLVDGITFYLYFRDKTKYETIRNTINPITQTSQFIQNYGSSILEFQTSKELFFAIEFGTSSSSTAAKVETEILSVEGSTTTIDKLLTARKTFTGTELLAARMVTENGKSFRFRPTNCQVTNINVELYGVLADTIDNGEGWTELGQFALSENDIEVFDRLEPTSGLVDSNWPRYNDDAFVKIQNYKDRWNVQNPSTLSTIKQTVQDYVALSDEEDNPSALETFRFSDTLPDGVINEEDDSFQLANLTLLHQASMDFHVARMLGLGHLDVEPEVQNSNSFVYMAVYQTAVSLVDGALVAENIEHRFITAPISRVDEKLPVSLDLKVPVPGVFLNRGVGEQAESITDEDGYTPDGKSRFITLYAEQPNDFSLDQGFYSTTFEFNSALETFPVFAGIEYKKTGETDWRRPELPNTPDYQNNDSSGQVAFNETVSLPIPDVGTPLFVHQETETGEHIYNSYAINWFSRITRSTVEHTLSTTIEPTNTLLPPSDRSALLVIEERPLLLTTANEQQLLSNISGADKTLIRLMFNYNVEQEILSYKVTERSLNGAIDPLDADAIFPDSQEIFANEVEIYFRDSVPSNITGKAANVTDHPSNELLSIITTAPYTLDSTGDDVSPIIDINQMSNFMGGVLVLEENEYIIQEVNGAPDAPVFTVFKKQVSDKLQKGTSPNPNEELTSPEIKTDGMFLAVENLQNISSWGTPNPHPLKVQIGNNWLVHREIISRVDPEGLIEEYVQKTRGIWDNASIEKVLQPDTVSFDEQTGETTVLTTVHKGQYKATFGSAMLANHPQSAGANPVQWHKGIMRVHTVANPNGERKTLEVFKIENIGSGNALVVYFTDSSFTADSGYDEIQMGGSIQVNFYPGYRIYLFTNNGAGISQDRILPNAGEGIKYSCFGFRSGNTTKSYYSRIAVPTVMFAQEVIEPLRPQLPVGALYATRPDVFGKATYTLTTQFDHTPHGVMYYRVDDDAVLNAIYTATTVEIIKQVLLESDQQFLANRWENLLGFDYDYPANSLQQDGLFAIYPETVEGYRLPNPDNPLLFLPTETPGSIIPGNMADRIMIVVLENFVPMTEVPLIYEYINDVDYKPIPKKQVIRSRNGSVLLPSDPDFDIAPMAKKSGNNAVQFTDFKLDGTSNNLYFYAVKELSNTMQMGNFSPILGPIKLVNTNPPKRPVVRQVVPILENTLLGIPPQIEVSVNSYPKVENIKKLSLYRALNPTDALSIRTMKLVREINLETLDMLNENIWKINDGFEDLVEVPFGDPLYYRVIASREIEYADKDDDSIIITEYMPSESSKLVVTTIVENTNPIAPEVSFTANPVNAAYELDNVVLSWQKTTYSGKYFVYKLNEQGQWVKIYEVVSNEETITVPLDSTDWGSNVLSIEDSQNDNQSIYHQFKVVVENTSGLLSQEETILTIPATYEYDGVGGMGIEQTFIIR